MRRWCGACGQPYDWANLTFWGHVQRAPGFPCLWSTRCECDNTISALKLVTHKVKGNKLGVEVKGHAESSKDRLGEALTTSISVDNAGAFVTMGELTVHKVALPSFDERSVQTR